MRIIFYATILRNYTPLARSVNIMARRNTSIAGECPDKFGATKAAPRQAAPDAFSDNP
jgi:hypothetical protein